MTQEKVFNRWLVVVGALLIQISLGAIYIYSVFKPGLKATFPNWSNTVLPEKYTVPRQLKTLPPSHSKTQPISRWKTQSTATRRNSQVTK